MKNQNTLKSRAEKARINLATKTTDVVKRENNISGRIVKQSVPKMQVEMDRLKLAIDLAKDIETPDRLPLYSIYEQILQDAHLLSQIRTARNTVLQSQFVITDNNDNEIKELSPLFQTKWFRKFIELAMDAEWWGHSLIELSDLEDGQFETTTLITRNNVIPEFGVVKINLDDEIKDGISYRDNLDAFGLIEVGDPYNLGLLMIAAREVIWKTYSRSDWSLASEKFGMPMLVVRTNATDSKELDKIEEYAQGFGSNGYAILNKEDEIDLAEFSGSANFSEIYQSLADKCDEYISKLINGQTMTSDDGASYSQANVHERILNNYTLARLQDLEALINDKLFPFLVKNGYKITDKKFKFIDLIPKEPVEEQETELNVKKKGLTII